MKIKTAKGRIIDLDNIDPNLVISDERKTGTVNKGYVPSAPKPETKPVTKKPKTESGSQKKIDKSEDVSDELLKELDKKS